MDEYIRHTIRSIAGGLAFVGLFGFFITSEAWMVLLALLAVSLLLLWVSFN